MKIKSITIRGLGPEVMVPSRRTATGDPRVQDLADLADGVQLNILMFRPLPHGLLRRLIKLLDETSDGEVKLDISVPLSDEAAGLAGQLERGPVFIEEDMLAADDDANASNEAEPADDLAFSSEQIANLSRDVAELNLNPQIIALLVDSGRHKIWQVCENTETVLLSIKGLGPQRLAAITIALTELDLTVNMDLFALRFHGVGPFALTSEQITNLRRTWVDVAAEVRISDRLRANLRHAGYDQVWHLCKWSEDNLLMSSYFRRASLKELKGILHNNLGGLRLGMRAEIEGHHAQIVGE